MEKIGKNHEKFKLMKDYIKKCPLGITISDDLQVLSIAVEYNLEIDLLPEFYTCYATKAAYIHDLVSNRLFIMVCI